MKYKSLYISVDGNRVRNIHDCAGATINEQSMDFADGADDDIEYTYDANGNTLTDSNKGVSYKWDYNNMLARVNYGYGGFGMSDYMQFTRTASGRMMARQYAKVKTPSLFPRAAALNPNTGITIGGTIDKPVDINRFYEFTQHDRYGHYEYTDEQLTRINTSTGYRDSKGTHVYVRDWQGNVRAVVSRDGGSTVFDQTTYYYPYGLPMAESTSPQTNPYKYTAKELLTDQSLNIFDYGARFYDPAAAIWMSVDPLNEHTTNISSYNYCFNNPVNYIDPNGLWSLSLRFSYFLDFGFLGFKAANITGSIAPLGGAKSELSFQITFDTESERMVDVGVTLENTEYNHSYDVNGGIIGGYSEESKSTKSEGDFIEDTITTTQDTRFKTDEGGYINSPKAKIHLNKEELKVTGGAALEAIIIGIGVDLGGTVNWSSKPKKK